MKQSAYGKPILISTGNEVSHLNKVEALDEITIQELIFNHPECLPISDIDESYNPIIPVCKELNTTVGPLDILMASPNGDIAIIETKLWRNPEARRIVIAQILDYAKELSSWTYEDLQREVNRRLNRSGNTLYQLAKSLYPELTPSEADFVDSVSRNLSQGRFLLLIAGDGIREGAIGITEFLSNMGHFNFSFAMIELSLFKSESYGTLVIPKTIVKTIDIPKISIDIPDGLSLSFNSDSQKTSEKYLSPEKQKEKRFYQKFWEEFISELDFDDPGQPIPKPGNAQNLFVYPGKSKRAWISAYFMKSKNRIGVYFRIQNDQEGNEIFELLSNESSIIKTELPDEVIWDWDNNGNIGIRLNIDDIFDKASREDIKEFFQKWLNEFVNVIRPRMKKNNI